MSRIFSLITNRNFILIFSVFLGFAFGGPAADLKKYTIFLLGLVMTFSMTGIDLRSVFPLRQSLKIMLSATLLNYLAGTLIILMLSFLLIGDRDLLFGMVVIGASPPGVAVIPFSFILKGDLRYAVIGTFGSYLAAVILAPLIILVLTSGTLKAFPLFMMMVKIIIVPVVLSRLLRLKRIFEYVERMRGKVIDIGFALIIYIAVGINGRVIFSDPKALLLISAILLCSTFGAGFVFKRLSGLLPGTAKENVTRQLFLTIKSSGFTAATSLALFGEKAVIPSAVLSVVVLLYLLFLNIRAGIPEN